MSYDENAYLNFKRGELIPCVCDFCKKNIKKIRRDITINIGRGQSSTFCNKTCFDSFQGNSIEMKCKNCNCQIFKKPSDVKENTNCFCSQSCSATYNNANKTYGYRRSKLEIWLEEKLLKLYPNIEFHFNRKDAIKSELDIYIPKLNLAFELNGIFHYEPIYGEKTFQQVKNNDIRKFAACHEAGISLCIIDTSKQKYVKESTCTPFLKIITDIIDSCAAGAGNDPAFSAFQAVTNPSQLSSDAENEGIEPLP